MPLALANTAPSAARVGDLMVSKMYAGDTQVFPSFMPVSMNKSGTTAQFGTSYSQVLGWVADTANYPGSAVVSDDLICTTGVTNGTISVSVQFENTSFTGGKTVTMQLKVGTTPVGSFTSNSILRGTPQVVAWSVSGLVIPAGAAIRLEALASATSAVSATNNSASYVRVTQA
ncbi:hypothetical protein [Nocardia grenadensis]|uniref:hypothetical protein n=1 Tax=Nocardia grenadensis TaxID=931537 RepID=UPI003D748EB8